jgi:hypothetical protein
MPVHQFVLGGVGILVFSLSSFISSAKRSRNNTLTFRLDRMEIRITTCRHDCRGAGARHDLSVAICPFVTIGSSFRCLRQAGDARKDNSNELGWLLLYSTVLMGDHPMWQRTIKW